MSQSGVLTPASGGGGGILTLTGNSGGAVGPDGIGDIDVVGSGLLSVTGNAGANSLTIDDNTVQSIVQTMDAVFTSFPSTLTINASEAVIVSGTIVGARDDFTGSAGISFRAIARRDGVGGATTGLVTSTDILQDSPSGVPSGQVVLNGNDVEFQVRGVAAETWDWSLTYRVLLQT